MSVRPLALLLSFPKQLLATKRQAPDACPFVPCDPDSLPMRFISSESGNRVSVGYLELLLHATTSGTGHLLSPSFRTRHGAVLLQDEHGKRPGVTLTTDDRRARRLFVTLYASICDAPGLPHEFPTVNLIPSPAGEFLHQSPARSAKHNRATALLVSAAIDRMAGRSRCALPPPRHGG
jgi:hypothetical protein